MSHVGAVLRGRPRATARPLADVEALPSCPSLYYLKHGEDW